MFVERHIRNLRHQKSARTVLGEGVPSNTIGHDGEFRLHTTGTGVKLYAKYNGKWYGFSPDTATDTEIFTQDDDKSISDEGNVKFPGGFIMQWGSVTTDGTSEPVTFPMAFPNKCFSVWITGYISGGTDGQDACGIHTLPTTTGFTMNSENLWETAYWLAIGN